MVSSKVTRFPRRPLRLEKILGFRLGIDVDFHEGFDEALNGLLVSLIFHGVLVYKGHDALLEDPLCHNVLTQG